MSLVDLKSKVKVLDTIGSTEQTYQSSWGFVNLKESFHDSSLDFVIFPFFVRAAARQDDVFDVTLVTHGSLSKLYYLDLLSRRWGENAFISLSLFVDNNEGALDIIETILSFRKCFPQVSYTTTIHLVIPVSMEIPTPTSVNFRNCHDLEVQLKKRAEDERTYNSKMKYPANLLRNIGRKHALSQYILVTDIDLIPSEHLRETFLSFIRRSNSQRSNIVYVIPTFEILETIEEVNIPRDKTSLVKLLHTQEARPFYIDVCWKCQKYTDYERWTKLPMENKLTIAYEIEDYVIPWEPFFISTNTIALYDERFRGYGFNRMSHVCEVYFSGYSFAVLNPAFLLHRGLKTLDSFHSAKEVDHERNRVLFRQFQSTLKDKYPHPTS